jgi:glutamate racemase
MIRSTGKNSRVGLKTGVSRAKSSINTGESGHNKFPKDPNKASDMHTTAFKHGIPFVAPNYLPIHGPFNEFKNTMFGIFGFPSDISDPIHKRWEYLCKPFYERCLELKAPSTSTTREVICSDSGLGGLIFAIELLKGFLKLPEFIKLVQLVREKYVDFSMVHFGDTSFAPYGNLAPDQLSKLASSLMFIKALLRKDPGLSYIACNTASTIFSVDCLNKLSGIGLPNPPVQIITQSAEALYEAAKNRIYLHSETGPEMHIFVFATYHVANTTQIFQKTLNEIHSKAEWGPPEWHGPKPKLYVHSYGPKGWVAAIEGGAPPHQIEKIVNDDMKEFLHGLPQHIKDSGAITGGLFCTHFPFLEDPIRKAFEVYPALRDVPMLSQGKLFAPQLLKYLLEEFKDAPYRERPLTNEEALRQIEKMFMISSYVSGESSNFSKACEAMKITHYLKSIQEVNSLSRDHWRQA